MRVNVSIDDEGQAVVSTDDRPSRQGSDGSGPIDAGPPGGVASTGGMPPAGVDGGAAASPIPTSEPAPAPSGAAEVIDAGPAPGG